jgi:hypothetical protein
MLQLVLLYFFSVEVKEPQRKYWYIAIGSILGLLLAYFFLYLYQKTYLSAKIVLASILYGVSIVMYFIYSEVDKRILLEQMAPQNPAARSFRRYPINSWVYLFCLLAHTGVVIYIFSVRRIVHIAPESILLYVFSLNVFLIDLFVYIITVTTTRKFIATLLIVGIILLFNLSKSVNLNLSHYTLDTIDDKSVLEHNKRLTFASQYALLKKRILADSSGALYPIVLISGDGGGSRAGMWLSQNLINFDLNTNGHFRDHIFSISTVSGSSVGLGTVFTYWEETKNNPSVDTRWKDLPAKVYANNFVGSSISGLLLTDFWKSLLPWGSWVRDRNSVLQDEEAYYTHQACMEIMGIPSDSAAKKPKVLQKDFMSFFYTHSGDSLRFREDRPLVFINSCRSDDGRRAILSPMKLSNDVFNDAIDVTGYLYEDSVCDDAGRGICATMKRNISMGQACNASELFPLFSAPAYIDSLGSFVDGGYHENSGLKTTLDVYQLLKDSLSKDPQLTNRYQIYIVYLKNGSSDKNLYKPLPARAPLALPVDALLSQPFEGSQSYFEERTKYVDRKDPLVQYVEVKLNHKLIVDSTLRNTKETLIDRQILSDLVSSIDPDKKDTTLNFPLARWLSKSVIRRMQYNARITNYSPPKLIDLLKRINALHKPITAASRTDQEAQKPLKQTATNPTRSFNTFSRKT